jgi:hypothetical protein
MNCIAVIAPVERTGRLKQWASRGDEIGQLWAFLSYGPVGTELPGIGCNLLLFVKPQLHLLVSMEGIEEDTEHS